MVLVTQYQYDGGAAFGDGNLTTLTQYADGDTQRVTAYGYDWRDRRVSVDGEEDFFELRYDDNLDRVIQSDRYDTTAAGNLVARRQTLFDARGRVYQALRYGVDPASGTLGPALAANSWYDAEGNRIKQQPAGAGGFIKTVYDGVGRVVKRYLGFDPGESSWADAASVADDTVVEQVEFALNCAGNVLEVTSRARYHTALDSQLGELTTPGGADRHPALRASCAISSGPPALPLVAAAGIRYAAMPWRPVFIISAQASGAVKQFNVGIVGYGWAAGAHIAAINAGSRAQVTQVCSLCRLDPAELSARHGSASQTVTDYAAMLADPNLHAVSICSYHRLHKRQVPRPCGPANTSLWKSRWGSV